MGIIKRYAGILFLFIGVHFSLPLLAQRPVVTSVVKNTGSMDHVVSIAGLNFGTDVSKLIVFFGAAKATTVITATDQLIEVLVPNGASFNAVTVTRLQTAPPGLTAFSSKPFLLSFGGQHPFSTSNLGAQQDYPAGKGLYEICACDFDGDNDLDIATSNKVVPTEIALFKNISTPGTISFASPTPIALGGVSLQLRCGDLNGDGLADLVVSGGDLNNKLYVLQNLGGTFSIQTIVMDDTGVLNIRINDLDLDGKPDLVVSHFNNSTLLGKIWVLKNQTTSNTIAMSAPISVLIPGASTTDGIDIADLDGDSYPEIITSQRQVFTGNFIYILKNSSSPGVLSMGAISSFDSKGTVTHVRAADMDNDGKLDVVVTQAFNNSVSIFKNKSTSSALSLDPPVVFGTDINPWGLDLGDLDGDGKVDIVACSISKPTSSPLPNLTILNNETSGSTLAFTKILQPVNNITRHPVIADFDGDGKPDIAFATIDDQSTINQAVSFFRNTACMIPEVKPEGPLALCLNSSFKLTSNVSGGATYTWRNKTTNTTVGTNNPVFTIPTAAVSTNNYALTISPQAGGISCPTPSADVTVNVIGSAPIGSPPNITSPSAPICVGSPLNLVVTAEAGFTYVWTGPGNFTDSKATATPTTSFLPGRYYVDVLDATGTCLAKRGSIVVEVIDATNFAVSFSESAITCKSSKILNILPQPPPAAALKWFEKTTQLPFTTASISCSTSGEYSVEITIPGCAAAKTDAVKISFGTPPVPNFSFSPAEACTGQNVTFTNLTTGDENLDQIVYTWAFGDGSSTDKDPVHQYTTSGSKSITLKATYQNGDADCLATSAPQSINIKAAPAVSISNSLNKYNFCPGDSLLLEVKGGTFDTYKWSTNATTSSIYVKEAGKYTAEIGFGACTLNAEKLVTASPTLLAVTVTPEQIAEGSTAQLEATGIDAFTWTPAESLSDATLAKPIASPIVTTTYTVSGPDANGCVEKASIVLTVRGAAITSKLDPSKLLSPNGLEKNKLWKVGKIEEYPQCSVVIYDEKGIKVYEAKPYNNDWDGTFKGSRLPDGVYYYVIRCDGEESKPRSGSITLLR